MMKNKPKPPVTRAHGLGERSYRQLVKTDLNVIQVIVQETDLSVYADAPVHQAAKEAVYEQRGYIEAFIQKHPQFVQTLTPYPMDTLAPPIVQDMIQAAQAAHVGPMAAVAGAIAEHVGRTLLQYASNVIVENGGDIFLSIQRPVTIGLYAGSSPLSLKTGLRIMPDAGISAICTSSGTVGHSLSLGNADAVCVLSHSCALADAVATAVGNRVVKSIDITSAINWSRSIDGVYGIVIIKEDKIGAWGQLELVPL